MLRRRLVHFVSKAWCWLAALAAVVAAALLFLSPGGAVVTAPVVSVDTDPTDNTATFVATIDPCREVTVGSQFQIDVTIEEVTNLAGFEVKLDYNPAILKVTAIEDYNNYFLGTAGDVTNWGESPTPSNPDTDGTLSMIAALFPLPITGASGEGALARVSLEAVGSGLSGLNLRDIKLADINNEPIGDETGDQIFDGPVANGEIAVDEPCSTSTPTPAPPVGGIAELPEVPDSSGPDHIALAGLAAAALVALTAGACYARRRWLR